VDIEAAVELIQDFLETEQRDPVAPALTPDDVAAQINLSIPEQGRPLSQLRVLLEKVVMISPRTGGRQFFDLLFGGRLAPAMAGDMIAAALNNTMHTFRAAGVHVLIERAVIERMCRLAGFAESADYLYQSPHDMGEPGDKSIQCGRRNDALKVWTAWQHLGDRGFERRIDRQMVNARYAADTVRRREGLELAVPPETPVVLFRVEGADSAALCRELESRRLAKLGHARLKGAPWLRMVCVNADLAPADIDQFFDNLLAVAGRPG
jgi:glutamate/tyrosine decarboxylase-like PLP-dependent enzyme